MSNYSISENYLRNSLIYIRKSGRLRKKVAYLRAIFTSMDRYKSIYIDREALESAFISYEEGTTVAISQYPTFRKYEVTVPSHATPSKISVYDVKGGKFSLTLQECKNKPLGKQLLEHAVPKTQFPNVFGRPVNIKNFAKDQLEDLVVLLATDGYGAKEVSRLPRPHGVTIVFEGKYGDICYLNHYNTGSFNVQGSAGLLKSQIFEVLGMYLGFQEYIAANLEVMDVTSLKAEEVKSLFENRIPKANLFLDQTVKNILIPAIITYQIEYNAPDNSYICFPAFRALEGFLKQIFNTAGIPIKDNFGEVFQQPDKSLPHELQENAKNVINCRYTEAVVKKCYDYLKTHRHVIFHVDGFIIGTKLIENIQDGKDYIDEIFELIEKCVLCIEEKDLKYLK